MEQKIHKSFLYTILHCTPHCNIAHENENKNTLGKLHTLFSALVLDGVCVCVSYCMDNVSFYYIQHPCGVMQVMPI